MKDLIEIVKSLEDSSFLLKGVSKTVQDEAKEQKGEFLSMLLGTLGASLLESNLAGKGVIAKSISEEKKSKSVSKEAKAKSQGWGVNRAGKRAKRQGRGIVRACYGNKKVRKTKKQLSKTNLEFRLIL